MGRILGVIKYGKKKKDSKEKDDGFKYSSILDSSAKLAEAGVLYETMRQY